MLIKNEILLIVGPNVLKATIGYQEVKAVLDLIKQFNSLPTPTHSEKTTFFVALPIPSYEQHRLAKAADGTPSILLSVAHNQSKISSIPIVLEHLLVQHNALCRIIQPGGEIEDGNFTVISCKSADQMVQIYFLKVVGSLIISLGPLPSQLEISYAIDKLVELFRIMTVQPRKSVQGLWAELFLIARSQVPSKMVSAWHMLPTERYDFSYDNQRIEVKSSSERIRRHYFSLEQLSPVLDTHVIVASLFVERAGKGTSVMELTDIIHSRLKGNTQYMLHIDQVIGLTLGENWRDALDIRFDRELAETSLDFFDALIIPAVNREIPPGVSEVRFKSDLTGCVQLDLQQYRNLGELFRSI